MHTTPGLAPYAWVYTDRSMMVRVVERATSDGRLEVVADGPAALRGRHIFENRADSAQFRARLERQLAAGGFVELWQSGDRLTGTPEW